MMNTKPQCVVYDELVKTSRYFIRGVTTVDVETVILGKNPFKGIKRTEVCLL